MARKIKSIAEKMNARIVARLPDTGGGAFGAARLNALVASLRGRLRPGRGRRPGRPTSPHWEYRPKVPMSRATKRLLQRLAEQASSPNRKVSPMQMAAELLEAAVTVCADE